MSYKFWLAYSFTGNKSVFPKPGLLCAIGQDVGAIVEADLFYFCDLQCSDYDWTWI
jgi:hypothetical protein